MALLKSVAPANDRGVEVLAVPCFAKGMTVIISRILHAGAGPTHKLGVITVQINRFSGVSVGDFLYLGGGGRSSEIRDIECILNSEVFKVYRCFTATGSIYDVIATLRQS